MRKLFTLDKQGSITGSIISNDPTLIVQVEHGAIEPDDETVLEIEKDMKQFRVKKDKQGKHQLERITDKLTEKHK